MDNLDPLTAEYWITAAIVTYSMALISASIGIVVIFSAIWWVFRDTSEEKDNSIK